MPVKTEMQTISDNSERYTMFAFSLLYSGIAPIATTIVWVFFILDIMFSRFSECRSIQRSRPEHEKNINSWNMFAEVISMCGILTNCVLLYTFTTTFNSLDEVGVTDKTRLAFVVGIEHLFIIFVILLKTFIPDMSIKLIQKV
jgi:hypothetical protein